MSACSSGGSEDRSSFGRSDEPVCWSQCGFASGYLSYANQREIYCIEVRCRGRGDAVCHMVCRPREEFRDEHAATLAYFDMSTLDRALEQVTNDRAYQSHPYPSRTAFAEVRWALGGGR